MILTRIGGRRRLILRRRRVLARRKVPPSMWYFISVLSPADYWTTGRRSMPLWKNYYLDKQIPEERYHHNHIGAGGSDLHLEVQFVIQASVRDRVFS